MTGIDFAGSRAILVGTGNYTHGLSEMPQAVNSLHAMRDLLVGPRCGWPEDRVTVLEDKVKGEGIERQTAALIHDAQDVLLFYYVGHGQLLDGEDLGMALVDTEHDPRMRSSTSWRFNDLREELKYRCSARVKVVLLDCCFSGLATKYTQGVGLADEVQVATRVKGAYTLTASRASQKARHEQDKDGLTYFTRFFTEVVWEGIPGKNAELSLKDIHEQVAARFLRLDLPDGQIRPEPSTLAVDTAEQLAFAHNRAAKPSTLGEHATPSAHHTTRAAPTPVRIERRAPWRPSLAPLLLLCCAIFPLVPGGILDTGAWPPWLPWLLGGVGLVLFVLAEIKIWRDYQVNGPLVIDAGGIRWNTNGHDREIRWDSVQRVRLTGNGASAGIIAWYHPTVTPPKHARRRPDGGYLLLQPSMHYGQDPYQAVNGRVTQALVTFAGDKYTK